MNIDNPIVFFSMLFLIFILGVLTGASASSEGADLRWKKEAVEHSAAHYNTITGVWEWNIKK